MGKGWQGKCSIFFIPKGRSGVPALRPISTRRNAISAREFRPSCRGFLWFPSTGILYRSHPSLVLPFSGCAASWPFSPSPIDSRFNQFSAIHRRGEYQYSKYSVGSFTWGFCVKDIASTKWSKFYGTDRSSMIKKPNGQGPVP